MGAGEGPRWLYEDDSHFRPTPNKWAARNISLNDFLNAAAVVDETSNLRAMSQALFQITRQHEWLTSKFLSMVIDQFQLGGYEQRTRIKIKFNIPLLIRSN